MTRRVIFQQRVTVPQVGDTITLDRWFNPMSVPVRRAVLATAIIASGGILPPPQVAAAPTVTLDEWFAPLREPTRRPTIHPAYQVATVRDFLFPATETVTIDKWFRSLAEPTRPAASIARAILGTGTFATLTPPVPSIGWRVPFSEPVRKLGLSTALQLTTASNLAIVLPETVTLDKWFGPLSQRLYSRPGLGSWLQQSTTRGALAPLQTDIKSSMWFRPLAEPTRPAKAIATAAIPYWTGILRIILNPETVTLDKWFTALSRPVLPPTPRYAAYVYWAGYLIPSAAPRGQTTLYGSAITGVTLRGDSGATGVRLAGDYR